MTGLASCINKIDNLTLNGLYAIFRLLQWQKHGFRFSSVPKLINACYAVRVLVLIKQKLSDANNRLC
jgi:hypothetical protein